MKYLILAATILLASHWYYPKWQMAGTEATLSWDVSGYYLYLPAAMIYKDLRTCAFMDSIIRMYQPTPDFQQAYQHSTGRYVMKYPLGQALQFLPFFIGGHAMALQSMKYPADGFSRPYQVAISIGSLIYALIGLFFLWKVLRHYFDEHTSGLSLLAIVVGTNYLNYAAIDGAMTHNNLFTLYALMLWLSIKFYQKPGTVIALSIGAVAGLAALTRPTEILIGLIPLIWDLELGSRTSIRARIAFLVRYKWLIILAGGVCLTIGSLQLFYWKYATGDWIVYSYQDQGFSWLNPHITDGFFSYKAGWLVYTPMMVFALLGWYFLFREKASFRFSALLYFVIFVYIAFAWDIWWYGGSLGQRTMVQIYPVLALPLAGWMNWWRKRHDLLWTVGMLVLAGCVYFNLWVTHQAHRGGLLYPEQMTRAYFFHILGKFSIERDRIKLLDNRDYYAGSIKRPRTVYEQTFKEQRNDLCASIFGEDRAEAICMNAGNQFTTSFEFELKDKFDWLRAEGQFKIHDKEWEFWKMTQMIVRFYDGEQIVKERMIRLHRLLNGHDEAVIYMDVRRPKKPFSKVSLQFWNADSEKAIWIDNLKVVVFDEA